MLRNPMQNPDLLRTLARSLEKAVPSVRRGAGKDAVHGVTRPLPGCLAKLPVRLAQQTARIMTRQRAGLEKWLRRLRKGRPGALETAFDAPVTGFAQFCQDRLAALQRALVGQLDPDETRSRRSLRNFCIEHDRDETPEPARHWALWGALLLALLFCESFATGYVLRDVAPTPGDAVLVGLVSALAVLFPCLVLGKTLGKALSHKRLVGRAIGLLALLTSLGIGIGVALIAVGIRRIALDSDLETALANVIGMILAGGSLDWLLAADVPSLVLAGISLSAAAVCFAKGVTWGAAYLGEDAVRGKAQTATARRKRAITRCRTDLAKAEKKARRALAATARSVSRHLGAARALSEATGDSARVLGQAEALVRSGLPKLTADYGDTHARVTGTPIALRVPEFDIAAETAAMASLYREVCAERAVAEALAADAAHLSDGAAARLAAKVAAARAALTHLVAPAPAPHMPAKLHRLPAPEAA